MSRFFKIDKKVIKKHARDMRKAMTESEMEMWNELRNRKLLGYKFLRQHPIIYKGDLTGLNYFIADFYCHEKRAVIELDGKIHDQTAEYDQFRDDQMKMMQIKVLRIKNEEVSDMKAVLKKILSFLESVQETQTRN